MKYVLAIVVLIGFIALTEAKRRVGLKPSKPPLHCMVKCGTVCTETFACKKDCVRECDQHTDRYEFKACKLNCRTDQTCLTTDCKQCITPCLEKVATCKASCSSMCGGTASVSEAVDDGEGRGARSAKMGKHANHQIFRAQCKQCHKSCMNDGEVTSE